MKKVVALALAFVLAIGILSGSGLDRAAAADKKQEIKLGITGEDYRLWNIVKAKLAKEDIDLQIISFADYVRPNLALADREIDLNAFQHYAYLNKFSSDRKLKLAPIGETILAPMGIYSSSLKSLKGLKNGAKVAIPNDATNEGRALNLLQSAGLLKVKEGAGLLPTIKDVVDNPKKLEIISLVATQIPRSLQDVDIAVINSGVAIDAQFSPVKDSIFLENAKLESSKPYINLIVAREEDKDNKLYQKVVKAYRSKDVKKAIQEIYQGAFIPAF